jgi:hypothetical protein
MKKLFFLFAFLGAIFFSNAIHAQEYKSAIGLRLGYPVSVSYKTFLSESNAVELFAGYRSYGGFSGFGFNSIHLGAAYQIHKPINGVDGLQWYYGFGASAIINNYGNAYYDNYGKIGIGISGYLGLDYTFPNTPISLTADWVPTYVVGDFYYNSFQTYGALAVRYVLN